MKVWITKYALTIGIYCVEGRQTHTPRMVYVAAEKPGDLIQCFHGEGREWHRSYEAARVRALEMRSKKIASLRKSIDALEKMDFPPIEEAPK